MNSEREDVDSTKNDARETIASHLSAIAEEGYEYDFFQLVRLLESIRDSTNNATSGSARTFSGIRFRPYESVVFPASDVKKVEFPKKKDDPVTIVLSFLGLYGFGSPLPSYLTAEISLSSPESLPMRDFMDMFNNRFYQFYYRAWTKYRPYLAVGNEESIKVRNRFMSLAGLSTSDASLDKPVRSLRLAAFAGQLGSAAKSAGGLRNLISGCMPGFEVRILENISRFVELPERPRLGSGAGSGGPVLGNSATIGQRIRDVSGKFRIVLGPLNFEQFESCLPGRSNAKRLQYLVSSFVTDFMEFDIDLRLSTSEVPSLALGDKRRELGWNTWLRQPDGELTSRIVHYQDA